jgi:hypothetical protein
VRDQYYKVYVVKSDAPAQQQDARRQAFYRCVEKAQHRNLIGVDVTESRRLIWIATDVDSLRDRDRRMPLKGIRHVTSRLRGGTVT